MDSQAEEEKLKTASQDLKETVSIKHYDRLITELRCPGCASPMKAPIFLCYTGHSICNHCITILQSCPLCKENFSSLRSLTLEALSAKAHFKCSNSNNGCKVRLPLKLLDWHEEQQCGYRMMKCFIGKVWGNCDHICRELDWKDHIEKEHKDKLFTKIPAEIEWNLKERTESITGYYVLRVMNDEIFYLYQVYDKINSRVMWTTTWASAECGRPYKQNSSRRRYAFEIEIYNPSDASKIICQRFPCHREFEKDILQEGSCVSIGMGDILRFVNTDKILFYRVNIHEVEMPVLIPSDSTNENCVNSMIVSKYYPLDFHKKVIEGVNHKGVPLESILTRSESRPIKSEKSNEDMSSVENENSSKQNTTDDDTCDSDPELEKFVNELLTEKKCASTPRLNVKRKFFALASKDNLAKSKGQKMNNSDDSKGSTTNKNSGNTQSDDQHQNGDKEDSNQGLLPNSSTSSSANVSKPNGRMDKLTRSLKNIKVDFLELKSFGKKKKLKNEEV